MLVCTQCGHYSSGRPAGLTRSRIPVRTSRSLTFIKKRVHPGDKCALLGFRPLDLELYGALTAEPCIKVHGELHTAALDGSITPLGPSTEEPSMPPPPWDGVGSDDDDADPFGQLEFD